MSQMDVDLSRYTYSCLGSSSSSRGQLIWTAHTRDLDDGVLRAPDAFDDVRRK
ncbi:MAG TPA: hypothetical protein PKD37_05065 [Oligoflexia bacterium]|nr:hypothetical protein [Oligoflexia bacterium]HMP27337.1 hypothetical protein [Oligoflexia bacterium]